MEPPVPDEPPPPTARTRRAIVWARRRRALSGFWRIYRRSGFGIVGLVMMVAFVLLAVFGPIIVGREATEIGTSQAARPFQPPNGEFWLGTDNFGRSVLALVVAGSRVSLIVGFAATIMTMVIGA